MFRFALAAALGATLPAYAASFQCVSAATAVEVMICSDAELSSLDDILASDYQTASLEYRASELRAPWNSASLLRDQRAWLKQRNACRALSCVRDAYVLRIRELRLGVCKINPRFECKAEDLEAFPAARASPDELRTRYCMTGDPTSYIKKPCTKEQSDYVLAHSRIAHGDKDFCGELLTQEFTLMDLPHHHFVSSDDAKSYLQLRAAETTIHPRAGRFDINNDGKEENVAWITAYSGAGRGCDVQRFVELDARRAYILDSELTNQLAIQTCKDYYRAFRYKGKIYLENRRTRQLQSGGYVQLLTEIIDLTGITGNLRRYVCEFSFDSK